MLMYKKVVQNDSEQTNEFVETEEFQEANEFEETEAFQEENEFAESAEFVKDSVPTPEAASTDWWQDTANFWENAEFERNTMSPGNESCSNDSEEELTKSQTENRTGDNESSYGHQKISEESVLRDKNEFHQRKENVEASTPPDLSSNQTEPQTVTEERYEKFQENSN